MRDKRATYEAATCWGTMGLEDVQAVILVREGHSNLRVQGRVPQE